MNNYTMPPAWFIRARANPFVPWVFIKFEAVLEVAIAEAERIKREGSFYAVHVRPT